MSAGVVLPVRRIGFRWVGREQRFAPCDEGSGTLLADVDALGRTVQAVFDGNQVVGYRLTHPTPCTDPAEVLDWLEDRAAGRRRTSRTQPTKGARR